MLVKVLLLSILLLLWKIKDSKSVSLTLIFMVPLFLHWSTSNNKLSDQQKIIQNKSNQSFMRKWNVCLSGSQDQNRLLWEVSWYQKYCLNFCLIQDGENLIIWLSISHQEQEMFKSVFVNKSNLMELSSFQLHKDWLSLMSLKESKCSKILESISWVLLKIWLTMNVANAELRMKSLVKVTLKWWCNNLVLR